MLPAYPGRILVEETRQTVSAQRRLQNRVAQRKFRERKAHKGKAPRDRILDLPVAPYRETTAAQYPPLAEQGHHEFDYSLDDFLVAEHNPPIAAPPLKAFSEYTDSTKGHQITQSNLFDWHSPTCMGSEMLYMYAQAGSLPSPIIHTNAQPFGELMGVPHATSWSQQEQLQGQELHQAYLTPPQSDASRANSPRIIMEASPVSTNSSKQHELGLCAQSAHVTTSLQHFHGTVGSARKIVENNDIEPPDPLLHVAIRSRSRDVIRVLFRRGAVSIDERDARGRTALHIAAELGDEALVSLLLEKGADPQFQDYFGRVAVYYAVEKGHHEVVELLLVT